MEPLPGLIVAGQDALATGFAVFLRIGAAIAVLPAFGEQTVSARIRIGIALALTVLVAPLVDASPKTEDLPELLAFLGAETVTGLTFGLVLRLLVLALQIAGTIAAQSTSLAQLFGGAAAEPLPAIGHLLLVGGLALVAISDLHLHLVSTLLATYQVFPPGALLDPGALARHGIGHVARAFALAFSLASPFVIGALVYNLALGAINRAMPQLMVAFVGAPAITGAGLALLALVAPIALSVWSTVFRETLANPFGAP